MTRLTLQIDELVVSSFTTDETPAADVRPTLCTGDISTCPRTSVRGGCA